VVVRVIVQVFWGVMPC